MRINTDKRLHFSSEIFFKLGVLSICLIGKIDPT